jgi:hypothetical protein
VDIGFDKYVNTTNTIKLDLDIRIIAPVAHLGHVGSTRIILLVTYCRTPVSLLYISSYRSRFGLRLVPSARTTSLSRLAASFSPFSDSTQEL